MSAESLLNNLRRLGAEISECDDKLHCRAPKGILTPEIRRLLAENKESILMLLRGEQNQESKIRRSAASPRERTEADLTWPAECLECERKIGQKHARLFWFLGQHVETSIGAGVLWQIFENRAAILTNNHLVFVHPDQVHPPNN